MKATIEEIARIAGVSKTTVSRVLNNKTEGVGAKTRQRIELLLEEMYYCGHSASHPLQAPRSKTVALILPDITNPFFAELAKAAENYLSKSGYMLFLGNTDFSSEKEDQYLKSFISKRVDGIMLISTAQACTASHRMPAKYGTPCVLMDRKLSSMPYTAGVFTDNEYAVFRSCELLIRNGSTSIAFISGPANVSTSLERVEGYKASIQHYNLEFDERLIKFGNYTLDGGYNAIMELASEGIHCTGIIAANDTMAIGAMKALSELSYRIPQDVEVIGFDNIGYSRMCTPPLTTIQQPIIEMGRTASQLLLDAINGKKLKDRRIYLQPKLLIRESTKKV